MPCSIRTVSLVVAVPGLAPPAGSISLPTFPDPPVPPGVEVTIPTVTLGIAVPGLPPTGPVVPPGASLPAPPIPDGVDVDIPSVSLSVAIPGVSPPAGAISLPTFGAPPCPLS